jgi:ATP-dependent RNA helicase UAP56/SUB2
MGKTAVFIISILNQIEEESAKPGYAIILGNTKELANQIKNEFDRFTEFMPWVRKAVFLGGVPIHEHIKLLKNKEKSPHIIIGTPGRLRQLMLEKHIKGENVKIFVLDECDKLIDETEMRAQVQKIFTQTGSEKQVMMFSATFPDKTKQICKKFMKDPFELFIDSDSKLVLHGLKQYYINLEENQKIRKLIQLLDDLDFNQVIIFTKHIKFATALNKVIKQQKFPSIVCTGDMKTDQRLKVYQEFKDGKYRVMVSTDVLGRGIDIEKINVVFNFDMPNEVNQYMHRVGRAGRFGTKGIAISFVTTDEDKQILNDIQSQFEVKIEELPTHIEKAIYMNN